MEERYMGAVTGIVFGITIIVCLALLNYQNIHNMAVAFEDAHIADYTDAESVYDMVETVDVQAAEDLMNGHQIRLVLPQSVTSKGVKIDNDYVNRIVTITINGIGKKYFEDYPMIGSSDNIMDITYFSENMVGIIELTLSDVKEVQMTSEDEFLYFDFVDPHDIYDYVVVVDAGHGGSVPGAYKMGVSEKNIDLDIVLELKKCFDRQDRNIGVYYTRTTDCNPSFQSRVDLPNDVDADAFISIHNNSTASGRMSNISGTEVMYRGADSTGESKALAQICLDHLLNDLGSKNKGTVVGDDIFIIRETKMPVALIEVGFMTNADELAKLSDEEYQAKAAKSIYDAIIEYLYDD